MKKLIVKDISRKKVTDNTSVTIEISELNSEAGILGKVNISIQKNHDEVFRKVMNLVNE